MTTAFISMKLIMALPWDPVTSLLLAYAKQQRNAQVRTYAFEVYDCFKCLNNSAGPHILFSDHASAVGFNLNGKDIHSSTLPAIKIPGLTATYLQAAQG